MGVYLCSLDIRCSLNLTHSVCMVLLLYILLCCAFHFEGIRRVKHSRCLTHFFSASGNYEKTNSRNFLPDLTAYTLP